MEALELFTDPGTIAAIVALLAAVMAALTGVGKLLIKIGSMGKYAADKNDPFDSFGAFFTNAANTIGKLLEFLGPGNSQPKSSK